MPYSRQPALTLHQLQVFAVVAHEGGFARAADVLFLSEPTVSDHIRALEQLLGTRLLERGPGRRHVEITPAGAVILKTAERVLATIDAGLDELQTLGGSGRSVVTVGTGLNFGDLVLPRLAEAVRRDHPNVVVQVEMSPRPRNLERLRRGGLDFAVVLGPVDDEELVGEPLAHYDLVLVGPPGHRLAGSRPAPLADLMRESIIMPAAQSVPRRAMEQLADEQGLSFNVVGEEGHIEAMVRAIQRGEGISAKGHSLVAPRVAAGELAILNVEGFPIRLEWFLAHRRGPLAPAARVVRERLLAARQEIESETLWRSPALTPSGVTRRA